MSNNKYDVQLFAQAFEQFPHDPTIVEISESVGCKPGATVVEALRKLMSDDMVAHRYLGASYHLSPRNLRGWARRIINVIGIDNCEAWLIIFITEMGIKRAETK